MKYFYNFEYELRIWPESGMFGVGFKFDLSVYISVYLVYYFYLVKFNEITLNFQYF